MKVLRAVPTYTLRLLRCTGKAFLMFLLAERSNVQHSVRVNGLLQITFPTS